MFRKTVLCLGLRICGFTVISHYVSICNDQIGGLLIHDFMIFGRYVFYFRMFGRNNLWCLVIIFCVST